MSKWMKIYQAKGENGLKERGEALEKRGLTGSKAAVVDRAVESLGPLPEGTGIGKVQGLLYRLGFLKASRGTVEKVIRHRKVAPKPVKKRRRNRPVKVRYFERAKPNDLWQTDIMTFMLRGQYRIYLIGFMDDNSRFLVGWGLFRRQTTSNVLEVFQAALEKQGLPQEVLSHKGRQ